MLDKILEKLIEEIAGANAKEIIPILYNKKDVNEFIIAKKMDLTINQVRNILYKLYAECLVSFNRKKDKKKGWFIYYWTLNTEKCLLKLEDSLLKKIEIFKNQLKCRENKRYYICKACNIEINEETALEHEFTCNECADVYELVSNDSHIKEIKSNILKIEEEREMVKKELKIITDKQEKKKQRKARKEIKEKANKKAVKKPAKKKKPVEKKISKKK